MSTMWKCPNCSLWNKKEPDTCQACFSERPSLEKYTNSLLNEDNSGHRNSKTLKRNTPPSKSKPKHKKSSSKINDKNCSTKCQTALQRSENVSQQILNQTQDVELLHLQLHNLSVSKHIDFSKAPDMKIIAANVESNLKDLESSRIELKNRGELLLNIFKFEPKNIGNIGAKKLWNKIKICCKDLINEIKLMDKMQNDYLNKLIELQSIIAKCNRKRDMKKLAIAMEKLHLSKHTFDEQLSKLSEKALCSLDEAIKSVLGTEAAKELTNNVTRDQNRYLQCKNKLDVLQSSITYHNKEIEESKQLHEYFHQDLSEIKTALRRIQCQIQNITITPVRYQFYSGSNECVKCVKCNHIVYALEYDVIFQLDYAKVIHDSCFNCCECGELISENDDNCVYIAEDGVKMYCGEACVKVTLKRQLNNSKPKRQLNKIKQDIKRNKQDNVRLNGEINRLNQDITSQKQMLEQATYKLQKSMRKLDNVVKQTGVKAEDLVYFVANVSAILPSILNSRDKLNCLSSNMHATKKMIDTSFRDGGKIRVDDFISNSQEFKHSLTKFIEPMKDNGIIYMSQLQCDDEKYSPLKITMNDNKLSEHNGTDNDNKMIIKQMEWNQLEHHERRALRRISCRDWRTEDKMGRKYTAKQAKICKDKSISYCIGANDNQKIKWEFKQTKNQTAEYVTDDYKLEVAALKSNEACENKPIVCCIGTNDDKKIESEFKQTKNQTAENVEAFNADSIRVPLKATEHLLDLANQWKSNESFQTALSTDPNLLVEYTTGNGTNESSVSQSDHSGESKRNSDDENGNNFNDDQDKKDDNDHNDEQDRKDDNGPNKNKRCTIHEYACNVSWHAVKLKQLEAENRQLKLLLQNQTYDNAFNVEENKKSDLLNTSLNLKIAAKLTKKTIPDNVDETFNDVFDYMSKYTHIYHENAIKDYKHQQKEIKVIDYGIHCKKTQKTLYAVCEKKNASNNVETVWKTNNNLYFDFELEQMYKIPKINLSFPVTISDTIAMDIKNAQKQIIHMLQNKTHRNNIIGHKNTPWANEDKIPINNKKSKQSGLTLILEKHEFVEKVEIFANKNVNNIKLIPIVRFNNANEYFYEIVWIVEIGKHINIGISFMHNKDNGYLPSAIYLDIHDEHKLVAYTHNCKCLESFNCIIDRLQIGDSKETRMHKRYKSKMRKKIKENENQMQNYLRLREQDMLVIDDIKKTCKNLQTDLQSLLERQSSLDQQQIACNQLHVMNAMNTLPLAPQPIPQYTFQVYNNQLVTQMDNLNRNQQQKDVN